MIKNHSITLLGHRTSITLEDEFFSVLKDMSKARGVSLACLVSEIETQKQEGYNLSSAIRVYILKSFQGKFPS